jgi:signal transduction histidine kinase
VSPTARVVPPDSQTRLLAALLDVVAGSEAGEAEPMSEIAQYAARMLSVEAGGVLRLLGAERAVVVGVWREGGVRGMPINAELDFDKRNSALGRAVSTGLPARADSYAGLRGELPVVMEAFGLRSSVAAPIMLGEQPWGAVVATTTRDEPLAADAERRLGGLAELIARALAAAQARQALEGSRLRIVEGGDDARRRLERGLHEGPHQHLLALLLKLRVARSQADDGGALARLLDDAIQGATDADAALRELARNIFPVALTERGLTAAVQALTVRAPVPVDLEGLPRGRFPPLAEATAYFAVAEALASLAQHSAEVALLVADERDRLVVEVRGEASAEAGAGLRTIAERVAAVGGALTVDTPAGGGTVVRAEIPIRP